MRLAVTGGTGLVGRFVVQGALADGHSVAVLSRRPPAPGFFAGPVRHVPYELGAVPALEGCDALVHVAFDHVPGRYRGGEGDDPATFVRRNLGGSVRLFEAARAAGVARVVFLSSRAVYGTRPAGSRLTEAMEPRPDTLYGEVKRDAEVALATLARPGFAGAGLRATGIYGPPGPGRRHKWHGLFADFRAGRPIAPRAGTEVHGDDVWSAIDLLLHTPEMPAIVNVSDILLDRRDLLAEVATLTGWSGALPDRANASAVNVMDTERLRALGWRPGGWPRLRETLPALLEL